MISQGPRISAVFLAFLITACTSVAPPSGGAPSTAAAPQPRSLTAVVAGEPTTLDALFEGSNLNFNTISVNMMDTLARLDPATNEVKPLLATGWKQVDPTNWQVTVRSGVKFHDGSTLTADDVTASVNYTLQEGSTVRASYLAQWVGAQKIDGSTVQITTKALLPTFPLQLQFVSVASATAIAKGRDFMATNVNGTGPYKLVEWKKGERLTLKRFDGYWGSPAPIQDVTIVWRKEPSVRADMVRTGEAQIAQQMSATDLKNLPNSASAASLNVYHLVPNVIGQTKGSIMSDERVRLAVNYAIDRVGLRDKIYGGQATLVKGNVASTAAVLGYVADMQDYPYDPEKAKSLISQAGATGKPVSFVCSGGRFINDAEACQLITAQLNQVGLNVTMTNSTSAVWLDTYRAGPSGLDRPDLLFGTWTNDTFDLASRTATTWFWSRKAGGGGGTLADPALDQMITTALSETDISKRRALTEGIVKYVHDHTYYIPLLSPNVIWGLAKNVDYKPLPNENFFLSTIKYTD